MAFKRSAVRSRLSPPPKRERFSPLPFFLFMPRFARCIRRRTRRQRLSAPVPRLPPRPTRPKAARPPAKRRRSRHLCASVGMGVQRTAGGARRAVRPPSVSSPCGSSIPRLSRRTPQKNSPAGSALFRAVIRCALLLTTTTAAAGTMTAKTPAPDVGARRRRAADALARRQFPQNCASSCPSARTHPRQNGRTQTTCQNKIRLPAKHTNP